MGFFNTLRISNVAVFLQLVLWLCAAVGRMPQGGSSGFTTQRASNVAMRASDVAMSLMVIPHINVGCRTCSPGWWPWLASCHTEEPITRHPLPPGLNCSISTIRVGKQGVIQGDKLSVSVYGAIWLKDRLTDKKQLSWNTTTLKSISPVKELNKTILQR